MKFCFYRELKFLDGNIFVLDNNGKRKQKKNPWNNWIDCGKELEKNI